MSRIAKLPSLSSHLKRAQSLPTSSFSYQLPPERIAVSPQQPRHDSKLLVVPRITNLHGANHDDLFNLIQSLKFRDLPSLLPASSLLVRNTTRVIPSRIPAVKSTGGRAEVLLLHPSDETQSSSDALSLPAVDQRWHSLLGGKNIRVGDTLTAVNMFADKKQETGSTKKDSLKLEARVLSRDRQNADVSLSSSPALPLRDVLSQFGIPPLPPYIRRPVDRLDRESYQTTFAVHDGSAAAPTAGLHVTPFVEQRLTAKGIDTADVVLHIGTGTFRQVEVDEAGDHDMHHETIFVKGNTVKRLVDQVSQALPVVALGTTSVRTIESLYWFGVRLLTGTNSVTKSDTEYLDLFSVEQWEPYAQMDRFNKSSLPTPTESLSAILDWCGGADGVVQGGTNLLIVPGYPFMITNALITNFHQPRSTLLMLVSAFYGGATEDLVAVYNHALREDYRFLSYGDSSIYADLNFFQNME